MTAARLRLEGVGCVRGGRVLFEGLDLLLEPGGAAMVRGANGAGKSSLLRVAAGLLRPAAGRVERSGGVALVDDRTALDGDRTLAAALGFWAGIDGAAAALDRFGLDRLQDVPVRMLSTGQRRRAALARAAAQGAALWLLDEPEAGLDADGAEALDAAIAAHRAAGGAVLVASHAMADLPGARVLRL